MINNSSEECPDCHIKLAKFGTNYSNFHDLFTNHKVQIQRLKCRKCKYEKPSSVQEVIGGSMSGDLMKIQAELGSKHSFRDSEEIFEQFSNGPRQINNHDRIKHIVESLGNAVEEMNEDEKEMISASLATELIINVDGGHIKTTEDQKSMEAMISVVYKPESIVSNSKDTRNYLTSKHCAASIKDDGQKLIISGTIVAALKQGLTDKTNVTALCDGAANCWSVVEAIKPLCNKITYFGLASSWHEDPKHISSPEAKR